jgi:hypothetical protein
VHGAKRTAVIALLFWSLVALMVLGAIEWWIEK